MGWRPTQLISNDVWHREGFDLKCLHFVLVIPHCILHREINLVLTQTFFGLELNFTHTRLKIRA